MIVSNTKKVLVVTSSILGNQGQSRALAEHFKASAAKRGDVQVTERDLVAEELPHLGLAELSSWQVATEERTPEQRELAARSDALIEELLAHDVLVLAVPLYNLGIPSQLKAWFDRILRAGKTFRYTANGPQGLVEGKRAVILAARGGQYAGTEMDSQTPHIKTMLGLIGIGDVEAVFAEGLAMGDEHREQALSEAGQAIDAVIDRV
ncbi:FMN-dependent NADH-azoreductase [Litchfieldella anticariensis FP35 = DSM 16096]|uniref:FMN dependent NADH:quinone oxidoreductase n=1 Tax=Litchfieldella anticariensis (strain DSM 16096 / CECT 5854 / CIP 108499 / LMG 22089 / FP35) TaxID=1121939 RepID=S2KNB5_LITA3|nr:NAD(P)H-dependent oxidoreductase [Halomonas anticariensis]EPC01973.1 FMN-dependent NADH-azoreductase [Halomonas anticariensis FP35 = DSM 16096]